VFCCAVSGAQTFLPADGRVNARGLVGTAVALPPPQEVAVKRRAIGCALTAAFVMALGSTTPGSAADVVDIRLNGMYFSEPATVRLMVAVEPHEANRVLSVEADSEDLYRASEITLSGADEKRLHAVAFKNLTAGHYVLRAEVRSSSGVRGMAVREVVVTGVGLK
jgi:hypothetical protein